MISFYRSTSAILLAMIALNANAGQDPIRWSMSGSLPAVAKLNHGYAIDFILTSTLPFTMPTPIKISNNSSPGNEVTLSDSCSGLKLAPNQSCEVGLILVPKAVGTKSLSFYLEYGSNKVQIPGAPLTTQVASNANSTVIGSVTVPLPVIINSNVTYPVAFQFLNNSSSTLSNVAVSQSTSNTGGFTQNTSTCGSTLAAGSFCTINGVFSTTATGGFVSLAYNLTASGNAGSATTSSIVNNNVIADTRTYNFINKCSQNVWVGFASSSVNSNGCASDSDCGHGSFCNPTANAGAGLCFYANPIPVNGVYQLNGSGGTNTTIITDYGNLPFVWSGNLAARTGTNCASGTCDTGDCGSNGGTNGCPVGVGMSQPATLGEFTLLRNSVDSYDVSIINGMNVGVEVTPSTTGTFTPGAVAAYNCQSPGNPNDVVQYGLGACHWVSGAPGFVPPTNPITGSTSDYVYVKPPTLSPTSCTSDSTCSGLSPYTTCGLSFNKTTNALSNVCGIFLGYVSADQVCSFANTNTHPGMTNNPGDAYFNCDNALTGSLSNFTNFAIQACKAQSNGDLGTCYNSVNQPVSTANCCGCIDWQNNGFNVPSTTGTCVATNPQWTSIVLGGIEWLKTACPTAYTYPFDDKASSFTCMDVNASHAVNTITYTVTFCPT